MNNSVTVVKGEASESDEEQDVPGSIRNDAGNAQKVDVPTGSVTDAVRVTGQNVPTNTHNKVDRDEQNQIYTIVHMRPQIQRIR